MGKVSAQMEQKLTNAYRNSTLSDKLRVINKLVWTVVAKNKCLNV